MATSTIPAIGDGTFEELTVNTQNGTGTVKIQRYGKMRFLFVDFHPGAAGLGVNVAQLASSDAPSYGFYIAVCSYTGNRTASFYVRNNGEIVYDLGSNTSENLRGSAAYMVP